MEYPVRTASELHLMLRAFRKSAGLTQAGMAALLGIRQQTYAALEANPGSASTERVLRVLRILKVDMTLSWSVRPRRTVPRTASPPDTGKRLQAGGKPKAGAAAQKRAAGSVAAKGKQGAAAAAGGAKGTKEAASARKTTERVIRKREDW